MKITVLKYGESTFEEQYIFKGGRTDMKLPITFAFYLIETSDKKILVDVGCDDGAGFDMFIFKKPIHVLEDYGISASDITDVVITHAHHDHIASIGYYKNATIHIQEKEYGYGKDYIPTDFKVKLFKEEIQITEHITVRTIGAHSIGSAIVICKKNDKQYVLCGDECYIKECFEKQIPTGNCYNPELSEKFVKDYNKENHILLFFHDPNILKGKIGFEVILEES